MRRAPILGIVEIAAAAIIMSLSGPFARWANLPSGAMAFVRTAVPTLILGFWILLGRWRSGGSGSRLGRKTLFFLSIASVLNAVRMLMFFESFRLTSIGNAIIVLYTWPAFVLLFGSFLLGEKLKGIDLFLLGLAFVGIIIVYSGSGVTFDDRDFLGMTLMLGCSLLYSLMIVLIRRENIERLQATFWQNLAGPFVFLPAFIQALAGSAGESWVYAGLNGLLVGTLAFSLFFSAFKRVSSATVGHVSYVEVIFAFIWGALIFHEAVDWRHLAGGGLIIVSMIIRAELTRRAQPKT